MKTELIVAVDVPDAEQAGRLMDALPAVAWFKIGLELFCAEGPRVMEVARRRGKRVFLDLKLHDIPRTVERAVQSVAGLGAEMLTIHAGGGREMVRAAADAARAVEKGPAIVAVSMLTSLDRNDLMEMGIARAPEEYVLELARLALEAGADGMVSSARELTRLRETFGAAPIFITPGIRLPEDAVGDQKRVATPAAAARDGASFIVVGRPITEAPDPAAAAARVLADLSRG